MELEEDELEEEEDEDEEEEDDEEDVEEELLDALSVVEALEELVWVLEVELDPLDVWVIVELELSVAVLVDEARLGPAPPGCRLWAPSAGASWPPMPTAVRPPPASAESAARRAQRRATLIGGLPC